MKRCFWPGLIFALVLTGSVAAQPRSVPSDYTPLKIIQTEEPRFPLRLQNRPVMEGEAWVVVRVDVDGHLVEWLVTGYTRKEFADEAVESLKSCQFEPATLHGEKWATVREVHYLFSRTGVVISQTAADSLANYLDRFVPLWYSFRAYQLRELDRIPVPSKVVRPDYPESLAVHGAKGSVTVEFYIDATGQVRMPAVTDWANDTLAILAVSAVKQWQFEPPLHKGQPVLVLVRQVFNFQPKP